MRSVLLAAVAVLLFALAFVLVRFGAELAGLAAVGWLIRRTHRRVQS